MKGGCEGGGGGWLEVGIISNFHACHLYGESIDMLYFKCKSVNFDNLFRNNFLSYNYLFP